MICLMIPMVYFDINILERCTTFDGGEAFSRNIPLRGKEIS